MPTKTWEQAVEDLRSRPDSRDLVRNAYLDDPLLGAAQRFHTSDEWSHTRQLLKARMPGRALELGAGRGIGSYALAQDGCEVVAIEPDPSNVVGRGAIEELARHCAGRLRVLDGVGEALPFPDATFDLIYGRAVLHHARSLERFCLEAARVLRPGGRFLAVREHVVSNSTQLSQFLQSHPLHRHYGGEYAYTRNRYESAIREAGLSLVRVLGHWDSPINYHPSSVEALLARRLGTVASRMVQRIAPLQRAACRLASLAYTAPGRHCAFLAIKGKA